MSRRVYDYLYGLEKYGILLGLGNIRALLGMLGHPERSFPSVHIVGTNGKGSTAAFIGTVLRCAGFRVGAYTSPHLVRFAERITVNGRTIPEREIERLAFDIRDRIAASRHASRPFTFFEVTTALAFQYFAEQGADIAIIEAGLGGRLDATNVLRPLVTILTNVGIEHREFLGDTLEKIAYEKAAVIKRGVPCVTGAKEEEALSVIGDLARRRRSPLFVMNRDFAAFRRGLSDFDYRGIGRSMTGLALSRLKGVNQFDNAAAALAALELLGQRGFPADDGAVRRGIRDAAWPGRFETLRDEPPFIIDGAHNPHGVAALAANLRAFHRGRRFLFVLNVLKDKDMAEMVDMLAPLAAHFILAPNRNERSWTAAELQRRFGRRRSFTVAPDIPSALRTVLEDPRFTDSPAVFTGSLYGIGEAKEFLATWRRAR